MAYHVISKQYKHQGNNQHHSTSILLGRISQFVQSLTTVTPYCWVGQPQHSLFLKGPHISLVPGLGTTLITHYNMYVLGS